MNPNQQSPKDKTGIIVLVAIIACVLLLGTFLGALLGNFILGFAVLAVLGGISHLLFLKTRD